MIRLKVFISSVQKELRAERIAVGSSPAPLLPNSRAYLDHPLARGIMAAAEDRELEKITEEVLNEGLLSRGYLWFDPVGWTLRPTGAGALLLAVSPSRAFVQAAWFR